MNSHESLSIVETRENFVVKKDKTTIHLISNFLLSIFSRTNRKKTIFLLFACLFLYSCFIFFYALSTDILDDLKSGSKLPIDVKNPMKFKDFEIYKKVLSEKEKEINLIQNKVQQAFNRLTELEHILKKASIVDVDEVKQKPSKAPSSSFSSASEPEEIKKGKTNLKEIQMGSPIKDEKVEVKRNKVKEMMLHAWRGYEKFAWGGSELSPISKSKHSTNIFGDRDFGVTIVDSLDTLYIMGLNEEYKRAREWISEKLTFDVPSSVSLFEFNIRYLGSFLTMYSFTGDKLYMNKSMELVRKLEPAFRTSSGLPRSLVNLKTGHSVNYNWAASSCCILSEVGTLHMEFAFLSELTKDKQYLDKVMKIRSVLKKKRKPGSGLYFNYLHPESGDWCQDHASLAGLGDSFYEYLLKEWLRSGDLESLSMYIDSLEAVERFMLRKSVNHLLYLGDYKYGQTQTKMDHLACFAGGLFALGAVKIHEKQSQLLGNASQAILWHKKWLKYGQDITKTCHESYARTATHLGPEAFHFGKDFEATASTVNERVYILRPETVESYFYLWRLTKDQIYRDWAWDVVEALEKYCRVDSGGYAGIMDVSSYTPSKDDVQQSFYLAETLKYLYLIFSEDDLLPLDKWIFNTEAHPLPVTVSQ